MPQGANQNLFALLDENSDDENEGAPVQKKEPKPAAAKPAKEESKKDAAKQEKKGGKGGNRGKEKGNREDRDTAPYDGSDKPQKPDSKEGRGKGRRDGEKGERKGKGKGKQYDRHSGSGRGKGERREGRGSYNWGDKTEDGSTDQPAAEDGAEGETKPRRERAPREPREEEIPEEPEEPEEPTRTLDEYFKSQENVHVGPVLQERKISAEESTGASFKFERDHGGRADAEIGMIFNDEYDGKHHGHQAKEAREGWVQADKFLNMKFVDPNAGGNDDRRAGKGGKGSKGGKGGKGSNAGRGGSRQGSRNPGSDIKLDDNNAFPSLA